MKNRFSERMMEYGIVKTIQRNIELQLMQCLRCLFDSSIARSALYDHGDSLNHKPTVDIARKVIRFLIPKLPMFDDDKFATNDIIDTITKIFTFIDESDFDGVEEVMQKFDELVENPPLFYFTEVDHELSIVGDVEEASNWPALDITEENRENLELFAYFKYIFAVLKYRKASKESTGWRKRIKECLIISGPLKRGLLPPQMLHSLWAVCGYAHIDYFCEVRTKLSGSFKFLHCRKRTKNCLIACRVVSTCSKWHSCFTRRHLVSILTQPACTIS